jgi:hypothetical protein
MDCVPSLDPRRDGRCVRCGRVIDVPELLYRDYDLELEIVKLACRGKIDPEALWEHSQTRSKALSGPYVSDPDTILRGKNRLREAREEAADGVNHLLFAVEEWDYAEDPGELVDVISLFAQAYEQLRRLEEDMGFRAS